MSDVMSGSSLIRLPILYVVAEESSIAHRGTLFHLLHQSDLFALRLYMTLFLLPSDIGALVAKQPPFTAAMLRLFFPPHFRKLGTTQRPEPAIWADLTRVPALIIMVSHTIPMWLNELAGVRPLGVLTPSQEVQQALGADNQIPCGWLHEGADLREAYRVLAALIPSAATSSGLDTADRDVITELAAPQMFDRRPRLGFIPPLLLPPPHMGRAAAYMLNRLSNNVDEPGLAVDSPTTNGLLLPQMLDWSRSACSALALCERGEDIPREAAVSSNQVMEAHRILSDPGARDRHFDVFLDLGRQLTAEQLHTPMFAVPAPRFDLIRGRLPLSLQPDPDHTEGAGMKRRAVEDVLVGTELTSFGSQRDQYHYANARQTVLGEQRLLACESAWLASRLGLIPIQMSMVAGRLHSLMGELNSALEAGTKKIPDLFRQTEVVLAATLPEELVSHLAEGHSPIAFVSDVPFEWMLLGDWPVCLTRPVSRIPLGSTRWDVLCAALETWSEIDPARPEKVLVLDFIEPTDAIRKYTDGFLQTSARLGQNYIRARPTSADALDEILRESGADIVVVDAHGTYDRRRDEVRLQIGKDSVSLGDMLPRNRIPPVWILSACHTSVTGAIRGCLVRTLLARGAVTVIATLNRIDAYTASMFIGRLLTEIFSPMKPVGTRTLLEIFFATQFTTALLYDPLLPLIRRAERLVELRPRLAAVMQEFLRWGRKESEIQTYRQEAALVLGAALARQGLTDDYANLVDAGMIRPETLLFTAFGAPSHVRIKPVGRAEESGLPPARL